MARKFSSKVSDSFLDLVEAKGLKGYGAINITKRDKKVWAKVFVRYGTIYAIETSTYKINVLNRITMLDSVNDRSRNLLRQRFNSNPEDIRAVEAALGQQMAPENELNRIAREFFVDSFYEVFQWDQTTMVWNQNEEPKVPTIPAIKPSELIDKVETIRERLENDIAPALTVTLEDIENLKPSKGSVTPEGEMRTDEIILISYSEGNSTLREIAYATGRSLSMTKFMAKRLWEQNYINLTTTDGRLLQYVEPEPQPEPLPQVVTTPPVTGETPVAAPKETRPAPPPVTDMSLFDDEDDEMTSVEDFFDNLRSPQPVALKAAAPEVLSDAPEALTEPVKTFTNPIPVLEDSEAAEGDEEFDIPVFSAEELPVVAETEVLPELPDLEETQDNQPIVEEEETLMEPTSSNSKVSSRVAKMVNELKDVLREYRETIQAERKELSELHTEVSALHQKREEFLKRIDTEINEKSSKYTKLQKESEENSEEYNQTVAQLKALQGND